MIQPKASSKHLTVYNELRHTFLDQLNVLSFINPPFCLELIAEQSDAIKSARQAREITHDEADKYFNEIGEAIKTFEEKTRNHPLSTKVEEIKNSLKRQGEGVSSKVMEDLTLNDSKDPNVKILQSGSNNINNIFYGNESGTSKTFTNNHKYRCQIIGILRLTSNWLIFSKTQLTGN
jgi:hypothetical protein